MSATGWVRLHRELLASPIFQSDVLTRLWNYCLLRAAWKESKWLIPGTDQEVIVPRGSFITGRNALFQELYGANYNGGEPAKPCVRTLWRKLQSLAAMRCITVRNLSNRCSIVTVVNYGTYQDGEPPDCPAELSTDVPPVSNSCPAAVPPVSTVEEGKNIKKGRSKEIDTSFSEPFESWWNSYPKRNGIRQGKKKTLALYAKLTEQERTDLVTATVNYSQAVKPEFVRDPERFLKDDFWKDHLSTKPQGTHTYETRTQSKRNGPGQLFDPSTVVSE